MPKQNTFGPLELPSGRKIEFRRPLAGDRVNITQMMDMSPEKLAAAALMIDEYVAIKCITKVDGKPTDGDYKHLAAGWDDEDVMFYKLVFNEMFGVKEETQARAKEAARFLLSGGTSTAGCSSPDIAKSPTANG